MAAYDYVDNTGTVVADTSQTKQEVTDEWTTAFGTGIDLSDDTPAGVLVNAEALSRDGIATNNAKLANQINPNLAGGVFLDAILALSTAITGGRLSATKSTINSVSLTGVPSTLIPAGSLAISGDNTFESVSDVTLDVSGNGTVNFQAVDTGPLAADVGTLTTLGPGAVIGWETVNNTIAAVLGRDEESDGALRLRRIDTLGSQGLSTPAAVIANVAQVDGYKSLVFRENVTDAIQVIDTIALDPHSIFVCVDGGTDSNVATALLNSKTVGADWTGTTTVAVTEPVSGQSYDVKFTRPAELDFWIRVTVASSNITDPTTVVTDAVVAYANGEIEGERGFVVGADVSPFEIAGAVNISNPGLFVRLVEVSTDGITYFSVTQTVEIDEVARTDSGKVDVVIV